MLERLKELEDKYEELGEMISDPEIIADQNRWRNLMKEHAQLTDLITLYRQYKKCQEEVAEAKEMLNDKLEDDFREMVKEELKENQALLEELEDKMKIELLPKDPNDSKNVIVEIRGGAGGDEASLFAYDLFRMYKMYAETQNWKIELLGSNDSEAGGFKEVSFLIKGDGAFSRLKYESGVHRVQRVPDTESSGRIHTSTVTVAVLPEAEEVDVELNMNDVRVDVFRSSGNGGQSVNTTDSAVRITHAPTGIVISCQDEKSQLKNKDKALKVLRARLYELELQKQNAEISAERRSQVGTGDRSERIRTYNYPQGRVSDHRINLTLHRLEYILNGDLNEIIDSLITYYQAEKLKSVNN